ncbi:MAG: virginiamycin B lyase family protein [Solirubrobacteraceae bacterium]
MYEHPTRSRHAQLQGSIASFPLARRHVHSSAITVGPDQNLRVSEEGATNIGRMTPNGEISQFPISFKRVGSIAAGPGGDIWFGSFAVNRVGSITPSGHAAWSCIAGCRRPVLSLVVDAAGSLRCQGRLKTHPPAPVEYSPTPALRAVE